MNQFLLNQKGNFSFLKRQTCARLIYKIRAGIYNTIRQEALDTLKGEQYQTRVNDEIKTLSGKNEK